jgi:16S rRNA (adenine1518-N6/adenine1519-N6)-dimethyltransferase
MSNNVFAKKNLGQNFLTDKNKVKEIIESLNLNEDSEIIEVGPGRGALTIPLLEKTKNITAIEIDDDLIDDLNKLDGLKVIHQDVLKVDFDEMVRKETIFVSNLPYYISTKILFKVLENKNFISANVMMQKELIDRIYAEPNSKTYGRLSVSIRSFFDVEQIIKVPAACFTPAPKVESAFIRLSRKGDFTNDPKGYLEFIKNSFAQKRKK